MTLGIPLGDDSLLKPNSFLPLPPEVAATNDVDVGLEGTGILEVLAPPGMMMPLAECDAEAASLDGDDACPRSSEGDALEGQWEEESSRLLTPPCMPLLGWMGVEMVMGTGAPRRCRL